MLGAPAAGTLAARFCLSALWGRQPGLHAGPAGGRVPGVRVSGLGDGGDDLPQGAGAAGRLVLGDLPDESREERDLGAATDTKLLS